MDSIMHGIAIVFTDAALVGGTATLVWLGSQVTLGFLRRIAPH